MDFEVRIALDKNFVLAVDGHHRHFSQHIEHGFRFRVLVGLHVVAHAVDFLPDELALCLDGHAIEFLTPRHGVFLRRQAVGLGHSRPCFHCEKQQK